MQIDTTVEKTNAQTRIDELQSLIQTKRDQSDTLSEEISVLMEEMTDLQSKIEVMNKLEEQLDPTTPAQ